jgi:hypothetical protein
VTGATSRPRSPARPRELHHQRQKSVPANRSVSGITGIAVTVVLVTIAALIGWGPSRRFALGHVWCTITRHRLRSCLVQSRVMDRRGYVPWLLWVRPTTVGERVWLLMRPGICVEDLDTRTSQIAAACWARDARVRAWRRLVAVVLVDVVRRDPLTSGKLVGSPLTGLAGGSAPTALPGIAVDIGDDDRVDELGLRKVPDDGVEDWELGPDASGAVLAGSAHAPTLRVARGAHVHRPTPPSLRVRRWRLSRWSGRPVLG